MPYVIVCPVCRGLNTVKAVPDGVGGDYVCGICGYFFGCWGDHGQLDLGIIRVDPPGENNLVVFSEAFLETIEEPVDVVLGEIVE